MHGASSEVIPLLINSGTSCLGTSKAQRYLNPISSDAFTRFWRSNRTRTSATGRIGGYTEAIQKRASRTLGSVRSQWNQALPQADFWTGAIPGLPSIGHFSMSVKAVYTD
jgi:hypothetical protein